MAKVANTRLDRDEILGNAFELLDGRLLRRDDRTAYLARVRSSLGRYQIPGPVAGAGQLTPRWLFLGRATTTR